MNHLHPDLTSDFYKRRSTTGTEHTNCAIDTVHIRADVPPATPAARETLIIIHVAGHMLVTPRLKRTLDLLIGQSRS